MSISSISITYVIFLFQKSLTEVEHNMNTPSSNFGLILQGKIYINIVILVGAKETTSTGRILSLTIIRKNQNMTDSFSLFHSHKKIKTCLGIPLSHFRGISLVGWLFFSQLIIKVTVSSIITHDRVCLAIMFGSVTSSKRGYFTVYYFWVASCLPF